MTNNTADLIEDTLSAYERCVLILINIQERFDTAHLAIEIQASA